MFSPETRKYILEYYNIIIRTDTAKLKAKMHENYKFFFICDGIKCNCAHTCCQEPKIDKEEGKYDLHH